MHEDVNDNVEPMTFLVCYDVIAKGQRINLIDC